MRKLTFAAIAAMALALCATDTAEAQAQQMGMMGGGPRGGARQISPGILLRQSDALDLSEAQINTLTELRDGLEAAAREMRSNQEAHRDRMAELMEADNPDLNAIQAEFAAGHAAMSQFQWAQIEAGIRARNLLTDEQRGMVQGWAQAAGRAMGGRGLRRGDGPPMGVQPRGRMDGRPGVRGSRQMPGRRP